MIKTIVDVGSNSLKLLVAEVKSNRFTPLLYRMTLTRLAEGLNSKPVLKDAAVKRTLNALKAMILKAENLNHRSENIQLLATQAVRRAENQEAFKALIQEELGLPLYILSPQKEAELARRGALSDLAQKDAAVLDIGGGSSQLSSPKAFYHLPLGCVNLTEKFIHSDPPETAELNALKAELKAAFKSLDLKENFNRLVGAGGAVITLAQMILGLSEFSPEKIHGFGIKIAELSALNKKLAALTVAKRKEIFNLPLLRADIILSGGIMLETAIKELKVSECRVSIRGVAFGALLEPDFGP